MLEKDRDFATLPDGCYYLAENMQKGMGACRVLNGDLGKFELRLPTTKEEALNFYGFVTNTIEYKEHKESYYDTLMKGEMAVCYTRVPNNSWKTTEFVGELAIGDKCAIGYESADKGKVRKIKEDETATLEVIATTPAMGGYEYAMVIVRVLPY